MIKVLDSFISDKIAAGEVIERPVSVIKELVENSIDACADSIIVEIRNGGKSYIRVTDTGCGIAADELELAFERHATSKINSIEDLDNITSLGFRGEALASIAAISRLTIISRTPDSPSGARLIMHGAQKLSFDTVGTNPGTTIVIEDMFYNTPARRKFMGSDAREASAIIELIEHYAICYSETRFMLINNGTTVFTTDGDGDQLNAIRSVYPTREFDKLIPIYNSNVRGYISDPGTTKPSRRGQLFFVNGRLISSKVIEKGIEKGYNGRIFEGYPIAILFISINPSEIDVNIHPGKKEIKFLHEEDIINSVASAINTVMSSHESVPNAIPKTKRSDSVATAYEGTTQLSHISDYKNEHKVLKDSHSADSDNKAASYTSFEKNPSDELKSYLSDIKRKAKTDYSGGDINPPLNVVESVQEIDTDKDIASAINPAYRPNSKAVSFAEKPAPGTRVFSFKDMQLQGYVFNTYIILQKGEELYILDQHAAHERVFYERLMGYYTNTEQMPQPIINPIVINVSADIYCKDRTWINTLSVIGFDVSDFGPNTFIVRGIPLYMSRSEASDFAISFIENVDEYSTNSTVIDKLIMKSCKSAVKANENLSTMEINDLLEQLEQCDNPFCCPHGRPTFVKISKYEIEKSFKRK